MRSALILIAGLFLTGCGSSMVMTRGGSASRYAPTNETRGGVVKVMVHSLVSQKSDRESAYKRMYKFCGGPYRITSETSNREGNAGVIQQTQFGTVYSGNGPEYWYMAFECEDGQGVRP